MRKIIIFLLSICLLSGCSKKLNEQEQDSLTKYESYLNTLIEQERYSQNSYYYTISAVLNKLPDGTTRYDIFIENPQVAMYNVEILACVSGAKRTDETIYPSIGIFDEESYTMIPYQSNPDENYIEAIALSGITMEETPVLNVLVSWKNYQNVTTTREFIKLFPTYPVEETDENDEKQDIENKGESNE